MTLSLKAALTLLPGGSYHGRATASGKPRFSRKRDCMKLRLSVRLGLILLPIALVGHSWGTALGIKAAQLYPDNYYAYVGIGQAVDDRRSQEISYAWLLEQIDKAGNRKDLELLQGLGQPPFTDHDTYVRFALMMNAYGGDSDVGFAELALIALCSPEYDWADYPAWLRGANRGAGPMWESLLGYDYTREITRLNDHTTPLSLVTELYEKLDAPEGKQLVVFEHSSHTPFMAEPANFNREMLRVKEETYR
jgi:pimeloyl-ACP methyl ester carboxylesterase